MFWGPCFCGAFCVFRRVFLVWRWEGAVCPRALAGAPRGYLRNKDAGGSLECGGVGGMAGGGLVGGSSRARGSGRRERRLRVSAGVVRLAALWGIGRRPTGAVVCLFDDGVAWGGASAACIGGAAGGRAGGASGCPCDDPDRDAGEGSVFAQGAVFWRPADGVLKGRMPGYLWKSEAPERGAAPVAPRGRPWEWRACHGSRSAGKRGRPAASGDAKAGKPCVARRVSGPPLRRLAFGQVVLRSFGGPELRDR